MIGYLRGEILESSEGKLLVYMPNVGVGYSVNSYVSLPVGKTVELFIYTHVREDALDLYGFSTRSEKEVFLTLLSANGIGPKVAMGLLSKAGVDELVRAIIESDKEALTQMPGVGKKTAERVVLELSDKMNKKIETGEIQVALKSKRHPWVQPGKGATAAGRGVPAEFFGLFTDAHDALLGLGYKDPQISETLKKVLSEFDKPPAHAQELVKSALRQLA